MCSDSACGVLFWGPDLGQPHQVSPLHQAGGCKPVPALPGALCVWWHGAGPRADPLLCSFCCCSFPQLHPGLTAQLSHNQDPTLMCPLLEYSPHTTAAHGSAWKTPCCITEMPNNPDSITGGGCSSGAAQPMLYAQCSLLWSHVGLFGVLCPGLHAMLSATTGASDGLALLATEDCVFT